MWRILSVLSILWIGLAVSPAQGDSADRAAVVGELRKGNPQGALLLAKEALRSAPRDCSLLALEALAYTGLLQTQPALESFRKALTFCPTYLPALEGAAQIEYAQRSPGAIPLLHRILAVRPEDPTANAMLATTLRTDGRCPDAIGHYERSQALFATRPDLLQGYGSCLAQTGDYNAAIVPYRQLLASHPTDSIRYDVALLQWKTHANDDALATLAPLLVDAHQEHALALASKIHEEKGETPEAVSLLRTAIVAAPDDAENYLDFAAIAFNHRSFQVGIDMLDVGLKRLPNSAPLYVARGVLEVQLSKSEVAIADFEQAHRLDPKLSFAVDAVGIMQSQQHRAGESLALFKAQAKLHPDDPLLQYLLAEQLSESAADDTGANLTAAIVAAKRAVNLDPAYLAAHDLLAVLYVRAKQPQLAIQQAELALAQNPTDQDALYQEIMARRRSGDTANLQALILRFNEARKENMRKQGSVDRYHLEDEPLD